MLHKHAAAIRPYPLPTRQHAAARPNSRQIRQMSAMPADLPFQSQLAARPNNRRHHQPTAAHPPTTSTPNLSQTLMISRHLSSNAHASAPAPAAPLPSRKSPKILQIQLQTTRPTQITAHPQYPMTSYKRCYYPLSTIHYPLSTTHYPLPTIHYPLSPIHWCPLKTYPPPDRELLCYSLSDV